jgi:predicted ATP-grasp superfamily ATP-dependent carboligase
MIRMGSITRLFVYEYLSGGGMGRDAQDADDAEWLMQGRAMRNALVDDLAAIDGIMTTYATTGSDALAPSGAPAFAARPQVGESAPRFVRRLAERHDRVWVIAPETDGILAKLHEHVGDAQWIGCGADAIRIASSKRATAQRLRLCGVSTTRGCDDADMPQRCGRWVVKPDDGAGARNTRVHRTLGEARADLARREASGDSARLETWEEGEPLSLSVLCGPGGAQLLSINRQRIEIDSDAHVHYRGVVVNTRAFDDDRPTMDRVAQDVAQALQGLAGYVGIDVVLRPDGTPVVIEVNPRLTCAYVGLSAALGRNIASDVLARRPVIETPANG